MFHTVSSDADETWGNENTSEEYTGTEFDGIGEEDDEGQDSAAEECNQMQFPRKSPGDGCIDAERISLHLSSHLGHGWCDKNTAEDLVKAELHLREGQLNDSLHHI